MTENTHSAMREYVLRAAPQPMSILDQIFGDRLRIDGDHRRVVALDNGELLVLVKDRALGRNEVRLDEVRLDEGTTSPRRPLQDEARATWGEVP